MISAFVHLAEPGVADGARDEAGRHGRPLQGQQALLAVLLCNIVESNIILHIYIYIYIYMYIYMYICIEREITILYYTILYYTIIYFIILYYIILYYTILYYTILYYAILYYSIA